MLMEKEEHTILEGHVCCWVSETVFQSSVFLL